MSACFHCEQWAVLSTQRSPGWWGGGLVGWPLVGSVVLGESFLVLARTVRCPMKYQAAAYHHHQHHCNIMLVWSGVWDDDCGNFNQQEKVVVTIVDRADQYPYPPNTVCPSHYHCSCIIIISNGINPPLPCPVTRWQSVCGFWGNQFPVLLWA